MQKVPKFIADQYGSPHNFRKHARKIAQTINSDLHKLRHGCIWFPCGNIPLVKIQTQLDIIRKAISVKEWGR